MDHAARVSDIANDLPGVVDPNGEGESRTGCIDCGNGNGSRLGPGHTEHTAKDHCTQRNRKVAPYQSLPAIVPSPDCLYFPDAESRRLQGIPATSFLVPAERFTRFWMDYV